MYQVVFSLTTTRNWFTARPTATAAALAYPSTFSMDTSPIGTKSLPFGSPRKAPKHEELQKSSGNSFNILHPETQMFWTSTCIVNTELDRVEPTDMAATSFKAIKNFKNSAVKC